MTNRFFVPSNGVVPLCAQTDPDVFYPEKGASSRPAKTLCFACEARVECLNFALDNGEPFGIWGGKTARERRRLPRPDASEAA